MLESRDVAPISAAFSDLGWNKPLSQYEIYLSEQHKGIRTVFVAFVGGDFAGYVTINWSPSYPPYRAGGIPEIQDFNVLPRFRRQGIGTNLIDQAEQKIAERCTWQASELACRPTTERRNAFTYSAATSLMERA